MSLLPYLEQDKKNNDDKINFVLFKKIGKTTPLIKQNFIIKFEKNMQI